MGVIQANAQPLHKTPYGHHGFVKGLYGHHHGGAGRGAESHSGGSEDSVERHFRTVRGGPPLLVHPTPHLQPPVRDGLWRDRLSQ